MFIHKIHWLCGRFYSIHPPPPLAGTMTMGMGDMVWESKLYYYYRSPKLFRSTIIFSGITLPASYESISQAGSTVTLVAKAAAAAAASMDRRRRRVSFTHRIHYIVGIPNSWAEKDICHVTHPHPVQRTIQVEGRTDGWTVMSYRGNGYITKR